MEKFEKALENLKAAVEGGQEYMEKSGPLPLEYITENVFPVLQDTLKYLIEERHKVESSEKDDNLVIHYTSIAALVSMLQDASKGGEKSSFRLYDSVHLNDSDEGNYFTRHLNLPKKYDWLGKKDVSHAYIASFILPDSKSEKDDMSNNLVFWRTYGHDGEGCSLSLPVPRGRLQKVLYGPEEVKSTAEVLMPILDSLDPMAKVCKEPLHKDVGEKLTGVVWESLERIRYLYKSEIYEHENECRFVIAESNILDKDNIRFEDQDRNNFPARIRHYYEHEELDIKKLLITGSSITLGPCVSHPYNVPYNVCYYLKTLMRRSNLAGPKIKPSKIPYRKF